MRQSAGIQRCRDGIRPAAGPDPARRGASRTPRWRACAPAALWALAGTWLAVPLPIQATAVGWAALAAAAAAVLAAESSAVRAGGQAACGRMGHGWIRPADEAGPIALLAIGCRLDLARDPMAPLAAVCRSADAAGVRLEAMAAHWQALPAATLAMVAGAWWCAAAPAPAPAQPRWRRWGLRPATTLVLMLPALAGATAGARARADAGGLPWTPHALAASMIVGMRLADRLASLAGRWPLAPGRTAGAA